MDIQVIDRTQPDVDNSSQQSSLIKARPAGQRDADPSAPIGEGSILIRKDLALPIPLESRPVADGWRFVRNRKACRIERALEEQGWYLFYLVPDVAAIGLARSLDRAIQKALEKVLAKALAQRVNTVEIALVTMRQILGFWRVRLVAKMRHIQHGPYLFSTVEEMHERQSRILPQVDFRARELMRRAGFRLTFDEAEPSDIVDSPLDRNHDSANPEIAAQTLRKQPSDGTF